MTMTKPAMIKAVMLHPPPLLLTKKEMGKEKGKGKAKAKILGIIKKPAIMKTVTLPPLLTKKERGKETGKEKEMVKEKIWVRYPRNGRKTRKRLLHRAKSGTNHLLLLHQSPNVENAKIRERSPK